MDSDALYFAALLASKNPKNLRVVTREHLALTWQPVHDFCLAFLQAQGRLPKAVTVTRKFGIELPEVEEDVAYYAAAIRENAMRLALEDGLEEHVVGKLASAEPNAALDGAKRVVADVSRVFREGDRGLVLLDQRDNVDARRRDYKLRKRGNGKNGLPLPWDTLTRATGGLQPGDAWAILARPNIGKTTALMVTATYLWRLGFRVLFVSQETPPQSALPKNPNHRVLTGTCIRCYTADVSADQPCPAAKVPRQRLTVRMDALAANVSMWRLLKGRLTPQEEERFFAYLEACRDPEAQGWGQIRLVSTPAVRTVMDLEMEIIEYQPDVVLWDSAYLAAVGPRKNDAAGNLVIDFKLMLERCGVPGIVSWHFNRDVDEKATEASQNSAALTDELGRVFDVLVGMFRPPEAVDAGEAIWRTLKVRDGIPMRELRTMFMVKEMIDFREIGTGPPGVADAKTRH